MFKYIVQPTDTLHFIALKFNIPVKELVYTNNLKDPHAIYSGQTLLIPDMPNNRCNELPNTWSKFLKSAKISYSDLPNYKAHLIPPGVLIVLSADKRSYNYEDTIRLTLFKLNLTSKPLIFTHNTMQRYEFLIDDLYGNTIWKFPNQQNFHQMPSSICLEPQQTISYTEQIEASSLTKCESSDKYMVKGQIISFQTNTLKVILPIMIQWQG